MDSTLTRQSIAADHCGTSTKCVFSNLPNVRQVLAAEWLSDTLVCQTRWANLAGQRVAQRLKPEGSISFNAGLKTLLHPVRKMFCPVLRMCRTYGARFLSNPFPALTPSARQARLGPHWANLWSRLRRLDWWARLRHRRTISEYSENGKRTSQGLKQFQGYCSPRDQPSRRVYQL